MLRFFSRLKKIILVSRFIYLLRRFTTLYSRICTIATFNLRVIESLQSLSLIMSVKRRRETLGRSCLLIFTSNDKTEDSRISCGREKCRNNFLIIVLVVFPSDTSARRLLSTRSSCQLLIPLIIAQEFCMRMLSRADSDPW